ncbi:hypothetical protein HanXRQr2_Chr04g0180161 [Helianthus annuus]|uniref:Uncharacterized protein n=1 Tax=Helianthus annuus TaxID=4232 RepID=A0A9K3NTZ8_HELAN|nr:hypothetical protein HanXRQr2_Chr04g0180161 [Helianthus annuus]KAJ0932437.1 hypothetical protein HanPSC8_Chr04g0173621 [Helianthus annuus]
MLEEYRNTRVQVTLLNLTFRDRNLRRCCERLVWLRVTIKVGLMRFELGNREDESRMYMVMKEHGFRAFLDTVIPMNLSII